MTFFIQEPSAPPKIKARNPDVSLAEGFGGGLGAAITVSSLENDANFVARRTGVQERASRGWDAASRIGADAIRERAQQRGLSDSAIDAFTVMMDRRPPNMDERMEAVVFELAGEAATDNPDEWSDLDVSDEAIEKATNERLQSEYEDAQAILEMMPSGQGLARFIGGMIGITADVKNLPFLAAGGGGGSILRVMGREAMINATAEAAFLPSQFEMAERLEIPDPDVVTQLSMAAAAGGILGGAIEAGSRGFTYFRSRNQTPQIPGYDPTMSQAAVDEVEDILTSDAPRPFEKIEQLQEETPRGAYVLENSINPDRPRLIPDEPPVARAGEAVAPALTTAPLGKSEESYSAQDLRDIMVSDHGQDMRKLADDIASRVSSALSEGRRVTYFADGGKKAVEITEVKNGSLFDADGQRWGVGAAMFEEDLSSRVLSIEGTQRVSTDADLISQLEASIDEARAADRSAARPLAQYLRDSARGGGESLQIHPEGMAAEELRARGVTPRTMPGLFSRAGRKDFDNLSATELEAEFPGITDATGTVRGSDYLDRDGFLDVLARDLDRDSGWLQSRADMLAREQELENFLRERETSPSEDFVSGQAEDGGFFVDLNEFEFLHGPNAGDEIARGLDEYLDREGLAFLTEVERAEILEELQTRGGEAEYLIERIAEREIDLSTSPQPEDAFNEIPFPDAPASARDDGQGSNRDGRSRGDPGPEGAGREGAADPPATRTEQTEAGEQIIAPGIEPVSQRQRLEVQQGARLQGGDAPADIGLFDTGARAQTDMFDDPASPEARAHQDAVTSSIRDDIEANGPSAIEIVTDDGRVLRTDQDLLDYLDEGDQFSNRIDLCGAAPGGDA